MREIIRDRGKRLLMNAAGSALLAFGVCAFIAPYGLVVGGATGISLIGNRLFGVPVSAIAFLINVAVLPLGLLAGEKKLVLGSVLSSLFYPAALAVFERMPAAITGIADSRMMACLCGGIVCGSGIGLVMRSGASTGGLDIPVLLLHKKLRQPVNRIMNTVDTTIMLGQIPISGLTAILYGVFYTYVMTYTLNRVLTLGQDRVRITVISEQYEEICRALIGADFGVTMIYAESGYTKTPVKQVETVMTSERSRAALKLIAGIDPEAFLTTERIKDVRGQGFTMERIYISMD